MNDDERKRRLRAAFDQLRAQGWDEGYAAGQWSMLVSAGGEPLTNPYRDQEDT